MSQQRINEISTDQEPLEEVVYVSNAKEYNQVLKPAYVHLKSDTIFIYLSVFLVDLVIIICGATAVWPSPVIPKLTSNDSTINPLGTPVTTGDISMITGTPMIIGLIGSLLLPKLSNTFGRKLFIHVMVSLSLVCYLLVAFSTSVIMIVISKSIAGIFGGAAYLVIPIYVTEICEDHNRAKFGCFMGLFQQIGYLYMYIIGPIFSYKYVTIVMVVPLIPAVLFSFFVPESPVYLLSKCRTEECKKSLQKLRRNKTEKEISQDLLKLEQIVISKQNTNNKNKVSLISLFKIREIRTGLLLALLPVNIQNLSGAAVLMTFIGPFFDSAGTNISGDTVGVIAACIKISTFVFTSFVVEKIGRKSMLLFSSIGTSLSLFALGCFFYLKHNNSLLVEQLQWLPLTAVICTVFTYSLGLGPIPMAIMHEMIPCDYRAIAGTVIMTTLCLFAAGMTAGYPIIADTIGVHFAVFAFSFSCFTGTFLMYKYLPETKGMTIKEIQDLLKTY